MRTLYIWHSLDPAGFLLRSMGARATWVPKEVYHSARLPATCADNNARSASAGNTELVDGNECQDWRSSRRRDVTVAAAAASFAATAAATLGHNGRGLSGASFGMHSVLQLGAVLLPTVRAMIQHWPWYHVPHIRARDGVSTPTSANAKCQIAFYYYVK